MLLKKKIFTKFSPGIIKKYKRIVVRKINEPKWTSSLYFLKENLFVIISWSKKKLKIGISNVNDITKICKSFFNIFDKSSLGRKPPDDITVKAILNESKRRKSTIEYKRIIANTDVMYMSEIFIKL